MTALGLSPTPLTPLRFHPLGPQTAMAALGLPEGASEHDLDHVCMWGGRALLVARFALTAQRAQIRLMQSQFVEARGDVEAALAQVG